jgi:hypothetical protein
MRTHRRQHWQGGTSCNKRRGGRRERTREGERERESQEDGQKRSGQDSREGRWTVDWTSRALAGRSFGRTPVVSRSPRSVLVNRRTRALEALHDTAQCTPAR